MSQSETHRRLVISVAQSIQRRYPTIHITTDLQNAPGDQVPQILCGFRPDVIARSNSKPTQLVIAEAKTNHDINNMHTLNQINAFVNHLQSIQACNGSFILAVSGEVADQARTVLRFACIESVSPKVQVNLFDGLDFWCLNTEENPQWRLI